MSSEDDVGGRKRTPSKSVDEGGSKVRERHTHTEGGVLRVVLTSGTNRLLGRRRQV
jgi:hypothetical protein